MKRLFTFLLILILLCTCTVANANDVNVIVNGEPLNTDQNAVIVDSRTLVPLRAIFEALGADVKWDDNTKSVEAARRYTTVSLQIGSKAIYINKARNELDVSAMILNDRTMVPARAVSEALGAKVDWDADTKTVIITDELSKDIIDNYIKGEITTDEGTVVLRYFMAYPRIKTADENTNIALKKVIDDFMTYTNTTLREKALDDYNTCKANGFLFFEHSAQKRFIVTVDENNKYVIEFKEEIFDGSKNISDIKVITP